MTRQTVLALVAAIILIAAAAAATAAIPPTAPSGAPSKGYQRATTLPVYAECVHVSTRGRERLHEGVTQLLPPGATHVMRPGDRPHRAGSCQASITKNRPPPLP